MVTPVPRRRVDISPDRGFDFGDYQMNYMNYRDWRIIPSNDVFIGEHHYYRSNALGCQGPEIAPRENGSSHQGGDARSYQIRLSQD